MLNYSEHRQLYDAPRPLPRLGAVIVNSGYLHLTEATRPSSPRSSLEAYRIGHEDRMTRFSWRRAARFTDSYGKRQDWRNNLAKTWISRCMQTTQKVSAKKPLKLAQAILKTGGCLRRRTLHEACRPGNEFFQEWDLAKRLRKRSDRPYRSGAKTITCLTTGCAEVAHHAGVGHQRHAARMVRGMVGDRPSSRSLRNSQEIVIPERCGLRERRYPGWPSAYQFPPRGAPHPSQCRLPRHIRCSIRPLIRT